MMRLLSWALLGLLCACAVAAATCSDESGTEPAGESAAAAGQSDSVMQEAFEPEAVASDVVGVSLIAAGGARTCALTVEGEVICWGGGERGSQNLRAPLASYRGDVGTIAKLAVGAQDACALADDGVLICWRHSGDDQSVLARPDRVPGSYVDVSVGASHACGILADRSIRCWLGPGDTNADLVERIGGQFVDVTAGDYFTCAVEQGGAASCWRLDGAPTLPAPADSFTTLSAGVGHVCGVTDNQRLRCWGENGNGQAEPPTGRYTTVSASDSHSCALTQRSQLECWGDTLPRHTTPPPGEWRALTGGGQHFCAVRSDDTASCWAYPRQFWTEGTMKFPQGKWIDVDAYPSRFCALSELGVTACWAEGGGAYGEAPVGDWIKLVATYHRKLCLLAKAGVTCAGSIRAVDQRSLERWRTAPVIDLSMAGGVICALFDSGAIRCLISEHGIFGSHGNYVALSVGYEYLCAINTEQRVRCGTAGGPLAAVAIPPAAYTAISVDSSGRRWCEITEEDHSIGENGSEECSELAVCALTEQGDVTCWGKWTGEDWLVPDGPFDSIEVGPDSACGLRPSGALECWSDEGMEPTPTGEFFDVSVTDDFSCAVRIDGAIHCWSHGWSRQDWRDRPEVLIPGVRLAIERYERSAAP